MKQINGAQVELQAIKRDTFLGLQVTTKVKAYIFGITLFFLPLCLGGPQLLVGSIVNCLLIWAAIELPLAYFFPLILLPSLATFTRGIMFGPYTIFMIYMIPAIWIGNFLLMYAVRLLKKTYLGISVGGIAKAGFLFLVAYLLFQSSILPAIFLKAMGISQLVTVLIAGGVFLFFRRLIK